MMTIIINVVSRTAIARIGTRTRDDETAMIAMITTRVIGDAVGTTTAIMIAMVTTRVIGDAIGTITAITASTATTAGMATMAMAGIVAMAITAGTTRLNCNADTSKA